MSVSNNIVNKFFLIEKKKVFLSLRSIFGFGKFYSKELLYRLGVSKYKVQKKKTMTEAYTRVLFKYAESFLLLENFARKFIQNRIFKLYKLKTIRGFRHLWGYPVHFQRTRCNAKNARKHKLFSKYKQVIVNI